MPSESALLVPLRSNGKSLLAGPSVESVRRRLKFASLYFDRVFLEAGIFDMSAGPGGSSGFVRPPLDGEIPRWQTPARRGAEQRRSFTLGVGRDQGPGLLPGPMTTAIHSEATISWSATFHPFADELPAGTDWVDFTRTVDPTGDVGRMSDRWRRADERNPSLENAVPERFVRGAVIGHANRDLGFATQYGLSVSVDPLHAQVIAQRFRDDNGWKLQGFAVPILFPDVGDWSWEAVADLRRDRHMTRFRAILHEVEQEAASEAVDSDIEAALQRAYRRHLTDAQDAVGNIGTVAHKTLQGFVIGGITGFATVGLIGPIGIVASAALGIIPGTVMSIRDIIQRRKSRGWITLQQRIDGRFEPGD
jgi:hypothetical protein